MPNVGVATTTGAGAALVVDRLGMLGVETRPPREASLTELARHGVHVAPGRVMDLTMAGTRYEAMFAALSTLRSAPEFDLILAVVGNSAEFSPERAVKPIADLDAAGKPVRYRRDIGPTDCDLVLMMDVLEHVDEPEDFLAELVRVAAPAGRVVVVQPAPSQSRSCAGFAGSRYQPRSGMACSLRRRSPRPPL